MNDKNQPTARDVRPDGRTTMTDKPFRRYFRLEVRNDALPNDPWRFVSTFATRDAAVKEQSYWLRHRTTRIIDTRTGQDVTTESEPTDDPEARVLAAEVAARGYRDRAEQAEAERDALAAQIERVRALHRPTTVEATQGECAAEECAHGDACPTIPVGVCAECYRIGEDVYPWAYEGDGLQHVEYPCPTIRALDGDRGE